MEMGTGISHQIIRKGQFELALDVALEVDLEPIFELTLGTGFTSGQNDGSFNVQIENLSTKDLISIHKRIGEVIKQYNIDWRDTD